MNERILVVDDEAAIADLVEVYLKNEGFEVCKCGTAAEALEAAASQPPDLAILDVMLPDMDGFTLCQRLRQEYFWPILMLTAKVEDMDKIMGLTLGADDYITKPFNPLELVARVKTQLRRCNRYDRAAAPAQEPEELEAVSYTHLPGIRRSPGRSSPRCRARWPQAPAPPASGLQKCRTPRPRRGSRTRGRVSAQSSRPSASGPRCRHGPKRRPAPPHGSAPQWSRRTGAPLLRPPPAPGPACPGSGSPQTAPCSRAATNCASGGGGYRCV